MNLLKKGTEDKTFQHSSLQWKETQYSCWHVSTRKVWLPDASLVTPLKMFYQDVFAFSVLIINCTLTKKNSAAFTLWVFS